MTTSNTQIRTLALVLVIAALNIVGCKARQETPSLALQSETTPSKQLSAQDAAAWPELVSGGAAPLFRSAGIVVGITPDEDYPGGPLAGIAFQRKWESAAFVAGGGTYAAPAQRVGDFLAGRPSTSLGKVIPSYKPGVFPTDLSSCLPNYAIVAIREALKKFGRQIKGYDMPDAVLTGVETRTSSPIRIKRDDTFQSLNTKGLYPAGEGAGYAGGILSAGVDGIKVAEAIAQSMLGVHTT